MEKTKLTIELTKDELKFFASIFVGMETQLVPTDIDNPIFEIAKKVNKSILNIADDELKGFLAELKSATIDVLNDNSNIINKQNIENSITDLGEKVIENMKKSKNDLDDLLN